MNRDRVSVTVLWGCGSWGRRLLLGLCVIVKFRRFGVWFGGRGM